MRGRCRLRHRRNGGRRKLPCGHPTQRIAKTGAEQVDAELFAAVAIDTGKDHLEQDLRLRVRDLDVEQVHNLSANGTDLDRAIGAINVLHGTAQKHRAARGRYFYRLAGKLLAQFAADGVDLIDRAVGAGPHRHVKELAVAALFPEDQAGLAGRLAVDHDFGGGNGGGFRKSAEAERDALHGLRAVQQHGAAHHHGEIVGGVLGCRGRSAVRCPRVGG
jgi:hypothetical protein